jgi:hypothetical protein
MRWRRRGPRQTLTAEARAWAAARAAATIERHYHHRRTDAWISDKPMNELERSDVPEFRKSMRTLGMVVAEVDRELRYVWIDNPHPDFDAAQVIGKRDDELTEAAEAQRIMQFKRDIFAEERPITRTIAFHRSDGVCTYAMFGYPLRDGRGRVDGVLTVGFQVTAATGATAARPAGD